MLLPDQVKDFNHLCDYVIDLQGHDTMFMSFSRGKDSIAAFLRILESGKFSNFFLYHYYLIPELSFVDDYLQYFSEKFGVKIIQVPNPMIYTLLGSGMLQTPLGVRGLAKEYEKGLEMPVYSLNALMDVVRTCYLLPDSTYCAVGVSMYDSMIRRTAINKYGVTSENLQKWYPIWDFKHQDIRDIIKKHDVDYPEDYDLFGLTFDGLDYRFLKPIHDKKPKDYQKIKDIFPLIDLILHKQEHYFGTKVRRSRFDHTK